MKKVIAGLALSGFVFATAIAWANGANGLTKDEAFVAMGVRLNTLNAFYSPQLRRASIAGQKAVIPYLFLRGTDDNGQPLDNANLPVVLSNLQADLKNTDVDGELRNAGIRIESQKGLAPRLMIFVSSIPSINTGALQTRKMYLVSGSVMQVMTVGLGLFGKREALTTGTFSEFPLLSTDDSSDAQNIRVAVRKIVDEYIKEAK